MGQHYHLNSLLLSALFLRTLEIFCKWRTVPLPILTATIAEGLLKLHQIAACEIPN